MGNSLVVYILMLITGGIHIFVGLGSTMSGNTILLLNGLGYLGLIALKFGVEYRGYGHTYDNYLIIAYTLITFLGYFVIWLPELGLSIFTEQPLAIITKIIELAIIVIIGKELEK